MTKITKREKFEMLKAMVAVGVVESEDTRDMLNEFIDNELAILAKKNAAGRAPSKKDLEKKAANNELANAFVDLLVEKDTAMTVAELREAYGDMELTSSKISAVLKIAVADGRVVVEKAKGKNVYASVK